MESCEKIICFDRDNNDNLATALLANGNNANNWMNNPFAYLMFLALFRNGWGNEHGYGYGNVSTQGIGQHEQIGEHAVAIHG